MKLGDYYRAYGDSNHLLNIEARLTENWQTTSQIAERSHRDRKFVANALSYLVEEQRAERRRVDLASKNWRWEWRRPSPARAFPSPRGEAQGG